MPLQAIFLIQTLTILAQIKYKSYSFFSLSFSALLLLLFFVLTRAALSLPPDLLVQVFCHRVIGSEDL